MAGIMIVGTKKRWETPCAFIASAKYLKPVIIARFSHARAQTNVTDDTLSNHASGKYVDKVR
jgi:hypothetical protein